MKKEYALLSVFGTAVISGFSIFLNKFGVAGINSSVFTFSKNAVVAILLISLIFLLGNFWKLKELKKNQWLGLVAVGLIGGSIPFLLFFRGLQLASSAAGSFVHKTMFIFVAIFAVIALKEKLHKSIFIASLFLLAGNFLVLKLTKFEWNSGSTLILIATIFWAGENTLSKHLLANKRLNIGIIDGNILAFGRMFFGSLFIMIYLIFTGEISLLAQLDSSKIMWIVAASILLFGYVVTWYNGLKYVKATVATSILLLGSPITTLLNYVFAGTTITPMEVFGSLLILSGAGIAVFFSERISFGSATHKVSE